MENLNAQRIAATPVFPAIPPKGRWTEEEHDQATAAYLHALETNDPDADRMRTVLGLFKHPLKEIGPRIAI